MQRYFIVRVHWYDSDYNYKKCTDHLLYAAQNFVDVAAKVIEDYDDEIEGYDIREVGDGCGYGIFISESLFNTLENGDVDIVECTASERKTKKAVKEDAE